MFWKIYKSFADINQRPIFLCISKLKVSENNKQKGLQYTKFKSVKIDSHHSYSIAFLSTNIVIHIYEPLYVPRNISSDLHNNLMRYILYFSYFTLVNILLLIPSTMILLQ